MIFKPLKFNFYKIKTIIKKSNNSFFELFVILINKKKNKNDLILFIFQNILKFVSRFFVIYLF